MSLRSDNESSVPPETEPSPIAATRETGPVKWYDAARGFGFVVTSVGDVLVHFSLLAHHDVRALPEGATLVVEAVPTERGWQARSILSIDLSTAVEPLPRSVRAAESRNSKLAEAGPFEPVTVRWFNRLKGYGFVIRDANGERDEEDVFVHAETLRAAGFRDLVPEQPLRVRVGRGDKGPLVVEVEPEGRPE